MAFSTGIGDRSRLPYHVRERIYSELADVRGYLPAPRTLAPFLGILQASKDLHDDVASFLFSGCVLQINMSSHPATVLFSREYSSRRPYLNRFPFLRASIQELRSLDTQSSYTFPFHIIDRLEIKLQLSSSSRMGDRFHLWRDICEIVYLLKRSHSVQHVVLFLQSELFKDPPTDQPSPGKFDYKFFLRPFSQLRQVVNSFEVETSLCSMDTLLDWGAINRTLGTSYESATGEEATDVDITSPQQLQRELARDWYMICFILELLVKAGGSKPRP